MELDNDLKHQFIGLENQIKKYKNWAIGLAALAFSPFLVALFYNFFIFDRYFTFEELGTYIGGISTPFGAISGILFVYVAFLGQRQQLIYNQQEIRVNRKALEDSLKEAESQRIAIEMQNKQFQIQSFENVFFKLMEEFRIQSKLSFSDDYGDEKLIEKVKKLYQSIKIEHFNENWTNLSYPEKAYKLGNCFDFAFSQGFARVRALISSASSILKHLENNRSIINHGDYLTMFYISLNVHESRIIFYGSLSDKIKMDQIQKNLFTEFLNTFIPEHLCSPEDKRLIKL
jgi:hypothetical protein